MAPEFESYFDRLGVRKLTEKEMRAAEARMNEWSNITRETEVSRLREKIEKLQDKGMILDCMKAIAALSLTEMRTA